MVLGAAGCEGAGSPEVRVRVVGAGGVAGSGVGSPTRSARRVLQLDPLPTPAPRHAWQAVPLGGETFARVKGLCVERNKY